MTQLPLISGRVERLLPGGGALVRYRDKQFLVSNAIPGDVVQCRIEGKRRGMLRGCVEARTEASNIRVEATCSAADQCGGCALQFLDSTHHAVLKSGWVRDAFLPFMDTDTAWHAIEEGIKFGQRRRARWWRGHDSEGIFLGFRAKNSHIVIRASDCQIVHPEMDALRLHIQNDIPRSVESVQMTRMADGMHLVFESQAGDVDTKMVSDLVSSIRKLSFTNVVIPWWRNSLKTILLERSAKVLHDIVPARDVSIRLPAGPDDFVQGHATGNMEMVRQVQKWAGNPRFVADLFCGIGNLSLPLAYAAGAAIRGADMCESSVRQANRSAKTLGLTAHYETVNLFEPFDMAAFAGADVLLLDPPRKGAKRICRHAGSLLPACIIMVNCDVAAAARDGAELQKLGYRLRALRAFDLFPYSGHVEAMSLWRR